MQEQQVKVYVHRDTGEEAMLYPNANLGESQERAFERQGFEFKRYAKPEEVAYYPPEGAPTAPVSSRSIADIETELRDAKEAQKTSQAEAKSRREKQAKLDKAANEDATRQSEANEAVRAAGMSKSTADQKAGVTAPRSGRSDATPEAEAKNQDSKGETSEENQSQANQLQDSGNTQSGSGQDSGDSKKSLSSMNRAELEEKARSMGINPDEHDTNEKLTKAIKEKEGQ